MVWLMVYILGLAFLVPAVHSATTSFIRPPNFDRGVDEDPSNNIRYEEGSSITIMWDTDLERIDLAYVQQLDNDRIQWIYLRENISTTRYTWLAQYDPVGFTENGEDAIGWFTIHPPGDNDAIRGSQRFNVTAPNSASPTESASTTVPLTRESATAEPTPSTTTESMPTGSAPSEEASLEPNNESSSALSSGAIAGIAVGATLGGLLVLGGIGFLAWRRFKKRAGISNLPGNMDGSQDSDQPTKTRDLPPEMSSGLTFKPELAAYPVPPAQTVRSHPGLHEAP